jgi:hypothetical protein
MILPVHILFHPLKHHLHTITAFIKAGSQRSLDDSLKQIKTMGASQFDLYTGALTVENIAGETAALLHEAGIYSEQQYHDWITGSGGYRTVFLSDGSEWTLRYLPQPAFVHVHPSRYALYTIRVKANAMKTVCCYLLLQGWHESLPDMTVLNQFRTGLLELSPVNLQNANEEIIKVYALLKNELMKPV